jgi:hypothetical protein
MTIRCQISQLSSSARSDRKVRTLQLVLVIGVVMIASPLLRSQAVAQKAVHKPGYPVQYGSRLNLSSASEIDRSLQATFTEGIAHPAGVENCGQLLDKCGPAFQGDCGGQSSSASDRDVQAQKSTTVSCLILWEMRHATPSTTSHVAKLKWDEHILPLLPPQLAINVSDESIGKAKVAATRGDGWPEFDKSVAASNDGPDQIVVQGAGFVERVILWGRGDLNGDGIEDLLVQSLDTLTGGSYRNTRLFILTRKTPGGKLTVVRLLL